MAVRFRRALVACAVLAPFTAAIAQAEPVVPAPLNFIVNRNGDPIGTHRLTFSADGERLVVDIAVDIKVKIAFITVYTYALHAREVWQDNRLVSFESDIDDNGTALKVRVQAAADGLHVEGKNGSYTAPADTMPGSYWRAEMVKRTQFIDIEDGHLADIVSQPAGRRPVAIDGRMVDTDVYRLSGEMDGELGYTPEGEWTLLQFKTRGSDILYTREP